jgi:hypothetical protein
MKKLMTKRGIAKSSNTASPKVKRRHHGVSQPRGGRVMNRFQLIAISTMLIATLAGCAQTPASRLVGADKDGHSLQDAQVGEPTVEQELKVLTEKLDLRSDQQARIKPILQDMRDATQKFIQNDRMSREERLDHVRPWRERADKKIRELLNDDQKEKLDQLERAPHPELHNNLSGTTPPPR